MGQRSVTSGQSGQSCCWGSRAGSVIRVKSQNQAKSSGDQWRSSESAVLGWGQVESDVTRADVGLRCDSEALLLTADRQINPANWLKSKEQVVVNEPVSVTS